MSSSTSITEQLFDVRVHQNYTAFFIAYEDNTARRSFGRELEKFLGLLACSVMSIKTPTIQVDCAVASRTQRPRPADPTDLSIW